MKRGPIILSLILSYIIFSLLLNSVGTVILQVIHHYGVSKPQAGILEGYKDLPIALVSFFFASFLPRLGYIKALQSGLILTMLACVCMPLFPSFFTTKLMFLAVGISFALVKISVYTIVGLIAKDKNQHASLLNMLEGFFMLGLLLGYWLFSLFINETATINHHWLNVYWWISVLCLINILLLSGIKIENEAPAASASLSEDFHSMLKLILKPMIFVFILSSFLYVLLEQSIGTWLPTFNNEILQFSKTMSVQAASIFALSLVLGRFLTSILLQKIDWYTLLVSSLIAMSLLIVLTLPFTYQVSASETLSSWRDAPAVAFLLPMIGLFMAPIYPAINSVMLSALPKTKHAAMTGLILFFSALGGTTGSMITGNLFAVFGGRHAFYVLLIPLFLLFFSFYRFRYLSERQFC
ncbi:MFS transporter [Legionella israelensis]|uniref:MFS transporter n=1 Tax=Legionella israelensis TaxID=454 RepID=UPI00117F71D3|nr:MFS transporter [Legionella israelensis]QDP72574.1 MFS transporter [Legionella israelensis]